jgi:hypothetical protein
MSPIFNFKLIKIIICLFISVVLFSIICVYIGFYCESYEYINTATFSGRITDNTPAYILYPITNIGLGHLYKLLFYYFPGFSWYNLAMTLFFIISVAAILYSLIISYNYKTAFIIFFFLIFFIADSIVNWNITRVSFLLCISASALLIAQISTPLFNNGGIISVVYTVLYTIGYLIRPESGILIMLLNLPVLILIIGFNKKLISSSLIFIPSILISVLIYTDKSTTNEFYVKLNPIEEYRIAKGNILPIDSMASVEDSMKYVALRSGMLNDPAIINYDFVNRIVSGGSFTLFNSDDIGQTVNKIKSLILDQQQMITVYFVVNALLLFFITLSTREIFIWGAIQLLLIITIWFVTYLMTMEMRVFVPLMFNAILLNIIIFHDKLGQIFVRSKLYLLYVIVILLFFNVILAFVNIQNSSENYKSAIAQNRINLNQLKIASKNKILVPDANTFMILFFNNYLPVELPDLNAFNKVFLLDIETLSLSMDYRSFLDKNCNCNSTDLAEFYDYLFSIREDVVLAGDEERVRMFENYLRIVRKRNFYFEKTGEIISSEMSGYSNISLFKIMKGST